MMGAKFMIVLDRAGLRQCGIRQANSTLLEWEEKGLFPRRFRIGRSVFWDQQAVKAHLARLAEEAGR
jgi:predicted DNA-binding transcriptional regulator AlpA